MTEDHKSGVGFKKVEWCKAKAPTEWVREPVLPLSFKSVVECFIGSPSSH